MLLKNIVLIKFVYELSVQMNTTNKNFLYELAKFKKPTWYQHQAIPYTALWRQNKKFHAKICLRETITIKQSYCQLSFSRSFKLYIICWAKWNLDNYFFSIILSLSYYVKQMVICNILSKFNNGCVFQIIRRENLFYLLETEV